MNQIQQIFQLMKSQNVEILENSSTATNSEGEKFALLKVTDIGKFFNIANPNSFFKSLATRERDIAMIEMLPQKQGKGRPAMYIAEPLFYAYLFSPANQTQISKSVKKWMKDEVLKSLEINGYYIDPDATSEQKDLLEKRLKEQKEREKNIEKLLAEQKRLLADIEAKKKETYEMRKRLNIYKNKGK